MPRKIVIIGANAAGVSAAAFARKTDRQAEITLIEKDKYAAYSRCGLPFAIAGEIPKLEDVVLYPPDYYKTMRLDLRLETEAKKVDLSAKTVTIVDKSGREEELNHPPLSILSHGDLPVKAKSANNFQKNSQRSPSPPDKLP